MTRTHIERRLGLWWWHVDLGDLHSATGWTFTKHGALKAASRAWGIKRP